MKRNMIAKKMMALLLTIVMLVCLAACGGSEMGNKDGNGNFDPGTTPEDGYDWSAGADGSGGEVTLRVATWRKNDLPYYEEIVRRFEETYDWITVELEINADSSSYSTNLQADIMSGTAPDVFDLHAGDKMVAYAQEGIIAPQTDFDYMNHYNEGAKKITTINGDNYGYMNAYNYFGFLYNKDIFEEEGVTVPKTPEEMIAVVNKLKAAGYGGAVMAGATYGASAITNSTFLICLGTNGFAAMQNGLDDGSITDLAAVPGVSEAYETMQTYTENDIWYNAYAGISYEAGLSLFAQEKSAIVYCGSYMFGEKDNYCPDINMGFFPVPTYANNGMTYAEAAQTSLINAASQHLGAAKLWIEFLATAEISEYYCTNAKMLSTIDGVEPNFEEAEELLASSSGYAIRPVTEPENYEYWGSGFGQIAYAVIFEGKDWEDLVFLFNKKLEEYDLANK